MCRIVVLESFPAPALGSSASGSHTLLCELPDSTEPALSICSNSQYDIPPITQVTRKKMTVFAFSSSSSESQPSHLTMLSTVVSIDKLNDQSVISTS